MLFYLSLRNYDYLLVDRSDQLYTSSVETGRQEVKIVHHQGLNKKILVALVVCSALLGVVFIYLLYVWIRRHKILTSSSNKNQESKGNLSDKAFIWNLLFVCIQK